MINVVDCTDQSNQDQHYIYQRAVRTQREGGREERERSGKEWRKEGKATFAAADNVSVMDLFD